MAEHEYDIPETKPGQLRVACTALGGRILAGKVSKRNPNTFTDGTQTVVTGMAIEAVCRHFLHGGKKAERRELVNDEGYGWDIQISRVEPENADT